MFTDFWITPDRARPARTRSILCHNSATFSAKNRLDIPSRERCYASPDQKTRLNVFVQLSDKEGSKNEKDGGAPGLAPGSTSQTIEESEPEQVEPLAPSGKPLTCRSVEQSHSCGVEKHAAGQMRLLHACKTYPGRYRSAAHSFPVPPLTAVLDFAHAHPSQVHKGR